VLAVDDLAPEALRQLLPQLGPLVCDPERVDGPHPDHPGQTFDYAVRRADGRQLAIEVTRAFDEQWMQAEPAWRKLATDVETAAQQRDPTITGMYAMAARLSGNPRAKNYEPDALAGVVRDCFDAGLGATVEVDDVVSFRYVWDQAELVVASVRGWAGEWEGGPESEARFRRALDSKVGVMRRAGAAGYETHLAVIHWILGTTHSWRQSLAEKPPVAPHPEHIWAVDLNVRPGTHGRWPAEHIWPIQ
jgi:hypothetical protein